MASRQLTVLVSGMMAGVPGQGGATWAVLQYVLGLRRLGHRVCFVEQVPSAAIRPAGTPLAESTNAAYFRQVTAEFRLTDAALLSAGGTETIGWPRAELTRAARRADVLVNLSGLLTDRDLTERIPVRLYVDMDPVFTQLWHAAQGIDVRLQGHTHYASVGLALGTPECTVPTCGLKWIHTLPPVVLAEWPLGTALVHDALTTVGHWRGYGSVQQEGVFLGQRAHAWRSFMELPSRTREHLLPALAIDPGEKSDIDALRTNGWELLDPARVAGTPSDYRAFVRGSKAELGIAKHGYVVSRSGWFSDRSACYLAAGRPVLAQDTGFGRILPTGAGLIPFRTLGDLVAGIDMIRSDYSRHARAARQIAEEHLDSDKVLRTLLARAGVT
jgi:hypothetical protein